MANHTRGVLSENWQDRSQTLFDLSSTAFYKELLQHHQVLCWVVSISWLTAPEEIIIGDLNFLFDDPTIIQHVTGAILTRDHNLDVVITRDVNCIIPRLPFVVNSCLNDTKGSRSGDHLGMYVEALCYSLPEFTKDIQTRPGHRCTSGTTYDLVEAYNSGIKVLIENHTPLQRKIIALRLNAPWYTGCLRRQYK